MTQAQIALKISAYLDKIQGGAQIKKSEYDEILQELALYECWNPFHRLMRYVLNEPGPKQEKIGYYIWLASVQYSHLQDLEACIKTCQKLVNDYKFNYTEFRRDVIHKIINLEDWQEEAAIIFACYKLFPRHPDIVRALERLTLLYEKKCPNDEKLAEAFDELLKYDDYNIKALKYFKLVFTQQNEWESVANILKKILHASKEQGKYRIAHELATVLVYQQGNYKEAIEVLNKYCKQSPLETANLYHEAYYRLGDFESCIKVLEDLRGRTQIAREKNLISYKLGHLYLKVLKPKKAEEMFEQVLSVDPHFFEAYEMLVNIAIETKNWYALVKILKRLKIRLRSISLRENLENLTAQLESAIDA